MDKKMKVMISEKLHLLVLLMQGLSLGTVQYNTPAAKTTATSLTGLTLQEVNTHRTHLNVLTQTGQYLCMEK